MDWFKRKDAAEDQRQEVRQSRSGPEPTLGSGIAQLGMMAVTAAIEAADAKRGLADLQTAVNEADCLIQAFRIGHGYEDPANLIVQASEMLEAKSTMEKLDRLERARQILHEAREQ